MPVALLDEYLSQAQVAGILGVKIRTLAQWRWQGRGPRGWFHVTKRLVLYPKSEVEAFLNDCKERVWVTWP